MKNQFQPIIINETIDINAPEILENVAPEMLQRFRDMAETSKKSEIKETVTLEAAREIIAETLPKVLERLSAPKANEVNEVVSALKIRFNKRMRTAGGRALILVNQIELNKEIHLKNPGNFRDTVLHELAHIIAPVVFGRLGRGHGRGWVAVMRFMGLQPNRCHTMEAKINRHKVHATGACGCPGRKHSFKTRVYNKVLKGATYSCRVCRKKITLEGGQ